jgi:hypothetical protein
MIVNFFARTMVGGAFLGTCYGVHYGFSPNKHQSFVENMTMNVPTIMGYGYIGFLTGAIVGVTWPIILPMYFIHTRQNKV